MTEHTTQTVLILGMHRSGTSALAGISHLLGAAAPVHILKPAPDNPTGFWESRTITSLNETVLRFFGHAWYDCLSFDPTQLDAETRQAILTQCTSTLSTEAADAALFLMKDPRVSLLLELWLSAFAGLDMVVAPLLALRHPTEVIASLYRRDGMPSDVAAPLWLHYMLEAEYHTRRRPRAVLSYDRLLRDWRGCMTRVAAATGITWPVSVDSAATAVDDFLRPQLRHHYATPRNITAGRAPISGWIAETYDALRCIEDRDDDGQAARLDQVRAAFAAWRVDAPRVAITRAAA